MINIGTTCGGAERLLAELAQAQRAAGHDVTVLASDLAGAGTRFSDVTWRQPRGGAAWLSRSVRALRNRAARSALAELVGGWRPDVVHLHTVGLLSPASLPVLTDTPTVLTVHGPELFLRPTARWCLPASCFRPGDERRLRLSWRGRAAMFGTALQARLWRRALRVVDLYTAPSEHLAAAVDRDLGPARLLPNGYDRGAPTPGRDGVSSHESAVRPRLMYAGRLEAIKGPHVLLAALPAVLAKHPAARLTVCGSGPLEGHLRELAQRLSVGHAVDFAGWVDRAELERLLSVADLVIVPSLGPEAFGLTCLEAFAAGTAVVASAVGGLPDLVRPGVTGLLVRPGDQAELAAAVSTVLADEPLRRRLGTAGLRTAAGYSLDAHARAVSAAYAEAAHRHDAAAAPARTAAAARSTSPRWLVRARVTLGESLLRNSATLLLATVELAAGGLVFWQVVAHLFAPADVGRAGVLISTSTLVANLALLGMNNAVIRYLPEWQDREQTVNTGMTLVVAAAIAGAVGVGAGMSALVPEASMRGPAEIAVFAVLTVAGGVNLFIDNVFVALRCTGHVLRRNTLVVALRLTLPAALLGLHAFGVFTAYWLAAAAALALYLLVLRRSFGIRPRLRVSLDRVRAMWRFSAGTYAATMILMLPTLLMPALVAQRLDAAHAAYYYIASMLAGVLAFVPQATTRSFFAEVAHDPARLREHLARVLQVTAALQVPVLAVLLAGGRAVLRLFGPLYQQAYPLLALLALSAALSSVGFIGSTLLLVSGRLGLLCQLSAVACAISVLGTVLLAGRGLVWVGGSVLAAEAMLATVYVGVIVVALRSTADTVAAPGGAG